jgi:competence protein ComEC
VAGAAFAFLSSSSDGRPRRAGLEVTFLDVGQGDATLLRTPRGGNVLVDAGPGEVDIGAKLDRIGVSRLDLAIITHPQRDHQGGFERLVGEVPISTMIDGGSGAGDADHHRIVTLARRHTTNVIGAGRGDLFELDGLRLEILSPEGRYRDHQGDPNQRALVILASFRDFELLLPADAESGVTGTLDLDRVEALKVAHHGSRDEGLAQLLLALEPRYAVIEVGANNYGHPHPSTLDALRGVPEVARTDRDGDVTLVVSGAGMRLER